MIPVDAGYDGAAIQESRCKFKILNLSKAALVCVENSPWM